MANAFYNKGLENLWNGNINWEAGDIKVVLVNHGVDAPVVATDEFLSDIGATARIATSANIASKTLVAGVIDSTVNLTISTVSGATVESMSLYVDSGAASTSELFIYIDTVTPPFPFTPNGGDLTIEWNASGIASIA